MANGLLKETTYYSHALHRDIRLTVNMLGPITSNVSKDRAYPNFVDAATRLNDLTPRKISLLYDELNELAPDTLQMLSKQIRASEQGMTKVDYFRAEKRKTPLPRLEGGSWASHFSETGEIDPFKVAQAVGLKFADMVALEKIAPPNEDICR